MNEIKNLSCKECGKPVPQTKGKRTKEYCSIACRSNNWQKRKRNIAGFSPLVKNKAIPAPKSEKPTNIKEKKQGVAKEAANDSESDRGAIEKQIAYIKAEKVPEHRNTTNGRKSWAIDQKKRIEQLENQLK